MLYTTLFKKSALMSTKCSLDNNKIGHLGATAIGEGLKANEVLEQLYLGLNKVDVATKENLMAAKRPELRFVI